MMKLYNKSFMKESYDSFFVVMIISMMLLCLYFVFIDTSLSNHVNMFFDIGFRLRTSEV